MWVVGPCPFFTAVRLDLVNQLCGRRECKRDFVAEPCGKIIVWTYNNPKEVREVGAAVGHVGAADGELVMDGVG